MDWRSLLGKITPLFSKLTPLLGKLNGVAPYAAVILLFAGYCAHYTAQQREIGALDAVTAHNDSTQAKGAKELHVLATREAKAKHALDSVNAQWRIAANRAKRSDSLANATKASYDSLRAEVLKHQTDPSVPVPTMPQLVASADAAINMCGLAKADCVARAAAAEAARDSAKALATIRGTEVETVSQSLAASQDNERRYKAAIPSTTAKTVSALTWATVGGAAVYVVCRFLAICR